MPYHSMFLYWHRHKKVRMRMKLCSKPKQGHRYGFWGPFTAYPLSKNCIPGPWNHSNLPTPEPHKFLNWNAQHGPHLNCIGGSLLKEIDVQFLSFLFLRPPSTKKKIFRPKFKIYLFAYKISIHMDYSFKINKLINLMRPIFISHMNQVKFLYLIFF